MTYFTVQTKQSAPENSKALLQTALDAYGFIPNLSAIQSQSPALLEGYMTLAEIFNKTDLNETERQIILMTNNRLNGCEYCMAAHTSISQMAGVAEDVIEALRAGSPIADAKLEALRVFAVRVNELRGWLDPSHLEELFAAGYTPQTALEVILGTSLKVMSNYTNHIADTPLDAAFRANAWSADGTV